MSGKTDRATDRREGRTTEPLPPWRNTRPRGNPERDERDVARGLERFQMVMGR